jgi:DNA polymerase III alpha subunit
MQTNKYGEMIFSEDDVIDVIMQGRDIQEIKGMIVDHSVDFTRFTDIMDPVPELLTQRFHSCSVPEFHAKNQSRWHMPDEYRHMDIAEHVLSLCDTQEQLQRVGQELLLYQQHDLFDLLRYMKYLVDVMRENHIIWGVGRGSSVASYVLYLLGVHRIDSMFYDLDPREFLR